MKKNSKRIVIFVVSVVLVVVGGLIYLSRGLDEGLNIEVNRFNVSDKEDGTYRGSFNYKRWSNTIEVEIKDEKIVAITIVDDVTFVKDGVSNELFTAVINQQDVPEDLVSEATITSKAYLKAIEDALKGTD